MPKQRHYLYVELISQKELPADDTIFHLTKSIDYKELHGRGLTIAAISFEKGSELPIETPAAEPQTKPKDRTREIAEHIKDKASKSPGFIGDLYSLTKNKKWWHLYIGACAVILLGTLLTKWFLRFLAYLF